MNLQELPQELLGCILEHCPAEDLMRCQCVSHFLRDTIQNSPRLAFIIDLAASGYVDSALPPSTPLATRQRLLASAAHMHTRPGRFALAEHLSLSGLAYWPIRDGLLLRLAHPEAADDDRTFAVTVVSPAPGAPTRSWTVALPVTETGILCVDPAQDLVVVRAQEPGHASFAFALLSLRTGERHPRAKEGTLRFDVSERVVGNPHYTRMQAYGSTVAVSMASGFEFFTDVVMFDWVSGDTIASFSSPLNERRWGDPAVLISPREFLLASYNRTERTCAIDVYVIDTSTPSTPPSSSSSAGLLPVHVGSYVLPKVAPDIEVRAIITPSKPHTIPLPSPSPSPSPPDRPPNQSIGLTSDPYQLTLYVHMYTTGHGLDYAGFFVPLRPFLHAADLYAALPAHARRRDDTGRWVGEAQTAPVPWAAWGTRGTLWLQGGRTWMRDVRRNTRGVGTRYVFPRCVVDFAPLAVWRERRAHAARPDADTAGGDGENAWVVRCDVPAAENVLGADMFDEPVHSALAYREKGLPEVLGYSPDNDVHLIGDKLVTVEGGVFDEVKIYQLMADDPPS